MSVQAPTAQVDHSRAPRALPASSTGRRILAHAIDSVAVVALAAAVYLPTNSILLGAVVAVEAALGLAVWEARSGRTLGKHLLGLRAAQATIDFAPGLRRAAIRSALLGLAHTLALVGQFLLIATQSLDRAGRGQAWHDRIAGTRVVSIRADAHRKAPTPRYAPVGTPPVQPAPYGQPTPMPTGPVPYPPPGTAYPQPPPFGSSSQHAPAMPAGGHVSGAPGPQQVPPTAPGAGLAPGVYGQHPVPPGQSAPGAPGAPGTVPGPIPPPPPAGSARGPVGPGPSRPAGAGQYPATGTPAARGGPSGYASSSAPGSAAPDLPEHTFNPAQHASAPADPRTLDPAELPDLAARRESDAERAVFVLIIDDGVSVTVSDNGLIGRRPQAGPTERVAHLVAVDDPGRSLSRTHAAFGIDGEDLWVEDRGSANGTVVVGPDGTLVRAFPGQRIPVPEDGRIEVGERSITVQRWQA